MQIIIFFFLLFIIEKESKLTQKEKRNWLTSINDYPPKIPISKRKKREKYKWELQSWAAGDIGFSSHFVAFYMQICCVKLSSDRCTEIRSINGQTIHPFIPNRKIGTFKKNS